VIHRKLIGLVIAAAAIHGTQAQSNRADTAARTSSAVNLTRAAQSADTAADTAAIDQAEFDLGEQQPVNARSGGLGAYALANTSLNYTSNAFLANGGRQGDMYFVAQGGGGLYPQIYPNLYLDGHVSQEVFQYAKYSSLNFSRFNAGGGLDYIFEELGGLTLSVRYDYERFLDGDSFSELYVNNAISTTLAKEFHLNDVMAIQAGGRAVISVYAEPYEARRNEYDLWVGWRWRLVEPLELQTYYMLSFFHYPSGDRTDLTQNVGATLNYNVTRWARISASANFGANNSTDAYFDYTVVNLGGTLALDFRF
jgi:hypothetical protein